MALASFSLRLVRCISRLASGVSGILFFLGFLGTITLFGLCCLASFAFAFLATLLSFLAGTLGFVLGRPFLGSGKVCWNIILLEHCAGRWRRERRRSVPSASAVFRFLAGFHDEEEEESKRQSHTAFIPAPSQGLLGLGRVNADLAGFVESQARHEQATLDMDATLIETYKEEALYCYQKHKA